MYLCCVETFYTMKTHNYVHAAVEAVRTPEVVDAQSRMYELARLNVLQEGLCCDETVDEVERKRFFTTLAMRCHDYGVSEDNAVMFTCLQYTPWRDEAALTIHNHYAEALHAVKSGERTWFTRDEEAALQDTNEGFREQDVSEQLFLNYFEPLPLRDDVEGGQWLTAIEIYKEIERLSKKDLGLRRATRFGAILTKH